MSSVVPFLWARGKAGIYEVRQRASLSLLVRSRNRVIPFKEATGDGFSGGPSMSHSLPIPASPFPACRPSKSEDWWSPAEAADSGRLGCQE